MKTYSHWLVSLVLFGALSNGVVIKRDDAEGVTGTEMGHNNSNGTPPRRQEEDRNRGPTVAAAGLAPDSGPTVERESLVTRSAGLERRTKSKAGTSQRSDASRKRANEKMRERKCKIKSYPGGPDWLKKYSRATTAKSRKLHANPNADVSAEVKTMDDFRDWLEKHESQDVSRLGRPPTHGTGARLAGEGSAGGSQGSTSNGPTAAEEKLPPQDSQNSNSEELEFLNDPDMIRWVEENCGEFLRDGTT